MYVECMYSIYLIFKNTCVYSIRVYSEAVYTKFACWLLSASVTNSCKQFVKGFDRLLKKLLNSRCSAGSPLFRSTHDHQRLHSGRACGACQKPGEKRLMLIILFRNCLMQKWLAWFG